MLEILRKFAKRKLVARNNYKLTGLPNVSLERAATHGTPRLNIVLIGIGKASLFGGADTALRLFNQLSVRFERLRIIVILEDKAKFVQSDWPDWALDGSENANKTVMYTRGRHAPVPVEDDDIFIATHWMTCLIVREALAVQPASNQRRFLYLLQDFEPGFYPWSGRHLLAQGTYAKSDKMVAVFNTAELYAYFDRLGFRFPHSFVFEPALNPSLAQHRKALVGHRKRRLLLTYGRPGTPRNAFDILVESLEHWARHFDGAANWEVISLGESHRDLSLSPSVRLRSRGKVRLDEYASYLSDAAVGFSLMVSPHPSYPPLEMASFGARVITNTYTEKNLATRSPLITSVAETTPARFAEALTEACCAFENDQTPLTHVPPLAFHGSNEEFPFLDQVSDLLDGSRVLDPI